MKINGIDWSGDIPNSWGKSRLKEIISIKNGREIGADLTSGISVYGSGGAFKYTDKYLYDGNSVLLGRKGTIDNPQLVSGKFWTVDTTYYTIADENKILTKIFYYMSLCFDFQYFQTGSTLPSMTQMDLGSIVLPVPPLSEQQAITDFLDEKTAIIDEARTILTKQIATLGDYKRALIYRAVTKGLDQTAKLVPSGVDWIGDVPEGWEIAPVKYFYDFFAGTTPDTKDEFLYGDENGYTWITIADMKNEKYVSSSKQTFSELFVKQNNPKLSPAGSLLYSFKLSVGKVAFAKKNLYTNEAIATFLSSNKNDLRYLYYSSFFIEENAEENIYGAKLLNRERIQSASIIFPPISEQQAIAYFLDEKTVIIDEIIDNKNQQLKNLVNQRKTLIYNYVTGKERI
ncbi:MAG: restriction endonuclease subunit S [Lactobacillaceae bacterium]|jgi:type I restriction enzyme S subunit|nr:restriction endonuclease subunit S [Lactobacillaceae bacterium]